ncbi:MAG: type II secretion system protein [Phycisphaerae bacterium]|nr:type II secretion system protein [Phycisphaerae bacterium]
MNHTAAHPVRKQAFTLIECLIVMLILMISIGGIMGFRYHAVLNAERAETHLLAARTAHVLIEAWKGHKGAADFDPTLPGFDSCFQIQPGSIFGTESAALTGSEYRYLGTYRVDVEGRSFRADLVYQNDTGIDRLRTLYVVISWQDKQPRRLYLSTLTQT